MHHRSLVRWRGFVLGTIGLCLAGAPADATEQTPMKIRFAGWGPASPETSFIWTGVHQGYFKEEGIDIEWVAGQGAGDSLKRVITGNATFGWSTTDAIIFGAVQGAKVKGVFNLHNNFYHVVYLQDRLHIDKIQDLNDKKIGVTSQASLTRYMMMLALSKGGMPQASLTYVAVGFAPGPPLQAGQIDAAVSWPNLTNAMRAAGMKTLKEWWTGLDYPTDQIVVSDETYTKNRGLVERFVRALVKGIEYENQHPEEAAVFVPRYLSAPVTTDVMLQYIRVTEQWMHYPATETDGLGYTDITALGPIVEELRKAGLIKSPVDLSQYITNRFQERRER